MPLHNKVDNAYFPFSSNNNARVFKDTKGICENKLDATKEIIKENLLNIPDFISTADSYSVLQSYSVAN